ncbi:MAG TPA: ABC transporter ATP-binding protein [Rhodococcus sp. (in: high G+C Gram-positive bacteria)]|nr:ABC transporter ATP-binding protein [Rhodococcus sp. (in: high G+C Gram-positive bacteria)]
MLTALGRAIGPAAVVRLRRTFVATGAVAVLEAVGLAMLVPLLTDLFADNFPRVWLWTALLVVIVATAMVAQDVVTTRRRRDTSESVAALQRRIADHATTLPLGWFGAANQDRLTRIVTDAGEALTLTVNGIMAINLRALVLGASLWFVLVWIDWPTAAVGAAGLVLLVVLYRVAIRLLRGATAAQERAAEDINGKIVEFAQNQPVLRGYGRVGDADTELLSAIDEMRRGAAKYFRGAIVGAVLFAIGTGVFFSGVLVVALQRADGGSLAVASAVCAVLFAALLVDAVAALGRTGSVIREAEGILAEAGDLLRVPALPEPAVPVPSGHDNSLAFDDVSFSYMSGRAVLRGVGFDVPAGTTCAVVGPSGSGKTTLARLVARFWDVEAGSVRIGGVDVRDMATADLMARVSLVFQDVYLFDGAIRENIGIADPGASDADFERAARLARVDDIVERLPDGWNTRVGDHGSSLSGGERQRVSIARAFLRDAPIVVLDEPTSALDRENETAILAALGELCRDRTVLVIAHRLHTVVNADRIVFLEHGEVTETGSHDELMAAGGRYADFEATLARRHRPIVTAGSPE